MIADNLVVQIPATQRSNGLYPPGDVPLAANYVTDRPAAVLQNLSPLGGSDVRNLYAWNVMDALCAPTPGTPLTHCTAFLESCREILKKLVMVVPEIGSQPIQDTNVYQSSIPGVTIETTQERASGTPYTVTQGPFTAGDLWVDGAFIGGGYTLPGAIRDVAALHHPAFQHDLHPA